MNILLKGACRVHFALHSRYLRENLNQAPMSLSATDLSQMPRIRSIAVSIPPAYPDPLRAWTEVDRICDGIAFPSTLRRLTIVTAPKHIRHLLARKSQWFEVSQRCRWVLKSPMQALRISVPGERANGIEECSAALRLLFPALHAHGSLSIEFPSQRESIWVSS